MYVLYVLYTVLCIFVVLQKPVMKLSACYIVCIISLFSSNHHLMPHVHYDYRLREVMERVRPNCSLSQTSSGLPVEKLVSSAIVHVLKY